MALDYSMHILLVEDSNFVRRSAKKSLNQLGFENVIEAEDGNEAIEKLEAADHIDVIVSDWVMPNKDGYELLVWVRANGKYKDTPFIMATARGEKKQVTKAVEAGVTDFITKPFSAKELIDLIKKVFGVGSAGQAADQAAIKRQRRTADGRLLLRVAHIQITDHLTLGVLKHLIDKGELRPQHFELETICMPSWNPVQQNLEKGQVDAAFILAPIAMDLYSFGVPISLILFAHKNGSICVHRKSEVEGQALQDSFVDKTFYIPHELSIHHMISHMFLPELGLKPGFHGKGDYNAFFEVVPPVKMPEYLAENPDSSGFMVAEPLGTKSIAEGSAELMFLSGEVWENHPCCVVAMRNEVINEFPEAVQEFSSMLVKAGQFIDKRPETAAAIGVHFLDPDRKLGLKEAVLKDVLKEELGIKTSDMYPNVDDLDHIQQYMVEEMGLSNIIDLRKFVDTRFAQVACQGLPRRPSKMHNVSQIVSRLKEHSVTGRSSKANLNLEGKYLTFSVGNGEYGLDIRRVREITKMQVVTVVPHALPSVRGVINLRGDIVPVIDLSHKLGMGAGQYDDRARIIILDVQLNKTVTPVGIAANSVSDVLDIQAKDIEEVSAFVQTNGKSYIRGYAKTNEKIRMLLDLERLFA